jgi:hypothetical protein
METKHMIRRILNKYKEDRVTICPKYLNALKMQGFLQMEIGHSRLTLGKHPGFAATCKL